MVPDVSAPSIGSVQRSPNIFPGVRSHYGRVCIPSSLHHCLRLLGFMRMNLKEEIPWTIIGKSMYVGLKGTSCPPAETKNVYVFELKNSST